MSTTAISITIDQRKQTILTPRNKEVNILDPRNKTQRETDIMADDLVIRFKSPEHRPLFLKCAWRLDQDTINRHVATSFELGRNPRAYFISLVRQDPRYKTTTMRAD